MLALPQVATKMENTLKLTFGHSPCPNDTFMFYALSSGRMDLPGHNLSVELHDVETLNMMAMHAELDMTKLSFHAWLHVREHYRLIESGAALGYGCGPLLISRRPLNKNDISGCRIALPGEWTTAHLLFRLWSPTSGERFHVRYDRIFDAIDSGEADCGVIIHESRFTFEQAGFHKVVDLGAWWEDETGLPIPLGCIAIRETISDRTRLELDGLIRNSIAYAHEHPGEMLPYVRQYAQEMTDDVLRAHIRTFVNEFSLDMGGTGHSAIAELEKMARQAGLIS